MQLTVAHLRKISKGRPTAANMQSIVTAVNEYGPIFGLDQPHRLAHLLAQLAHESGGFYYDREIASGAAYEGRKDLGNTQPGDGKKFKGRGPIQITGRRNYRAFTSWVRKHISDAAPDFEEKPELITTDPYEGLSPLWYWDAGNPEGKSLNRYADSNNLTMITVRINGGKNGLPDRIDYYDRAALTLLGEPINIKAFQATAGLQADGVSGPVTRAEMHKRLVRMTGKASRSSDVQAAPVVQREAVPVKLAELEGNTALSAEAVTGYIGGGGIVSTVISNLAGLDWKVVAVIFVGAAALGVGYLIWRRMTMAERQAAAVDRIEARNAL